MIHLPSGQLNLKAEDFQFLSPVPVIWNRNYHSIGGIDEGLLGKYWHLCYEQEVGLDAGDGDFSWLRGNGTTIFFPGIAVGEEAAIRSERFHYERDEEGLTIRDLDAGFFYRFEGIDSDPLRLRLVRVFQRRFSLILHYDIRGRLERLEDPAGRKYHLYRERHGWLGHVEVELPATGKRETLVTYHYNDRGELLRVTDALGQAEHFRYDDEILTSRTDRNGHRHYWSFDRRGEIARCTTRWQEGGLMREEFRYQAGVTRSADALGNVTTYVIEGDKVVEEIDALGNSKKWSFNLEGEVISHTDALGNTTYYDYDEWGYCKAVIYPNGGSEHYHYENHELVIASNLLGATWFWAYGEDGHPKHVLGPNNELTRFRYEDDLLREVKDRYGRVTSFHYDAAFNLRRVVFPDGGEADWQYDIRGRLVSAHSPLKEQVTYTYDALGRVKRIGHDDGNFMQLEFDGEGNITKANDLHRRIRFSYTPSGKLLSRREEGTEVRFSYDCMERLEQIENEQGSFYRFRYDRVGRVSEESGFDGLTRRYERDAVGNVTQVHAPDGKSARYFYDRGGNLNQVIYHGGEEEVYTYNHAGDLIEAVNAYGRVQFKRNSLGRVVREIQDLGEVKSTYDRKGRRTGITSSLGADIRFDRNREGQIAGVSAGNGKSEWTAQLSYDLLGLELERILPGGVRSTWKRDRMGRPKEHRIGRGDRLLRHRSYHWDYNERLAGISDKLTERSVYFSYDSFSRLSQAMYQGEGWNHRFPDEIGNLFGEEKRTDRTYGPSGGLLKDKNYAYTYDSLGNLVYKEGNGEEWYYRWYPTGMLREVARPDGKRVEFTYDALGRRISKTFDGKITQWLWDGNVPLHEWVEDLERKSGEQDPGKGTSLEASGQKPSGERLSGEATSGEASTEASGSLTTWVFEEGSFAPMAKLEGSESWSIVCNYLGTPQQMYDQKGNLVWDVEIDTFGKIRKQRRGSPADCPFRFPGQYEDEEIGLYYNRFRYYSPESGTYLSQDPIKFAGNNPNIYAYVKDSNSWVDPLGLTGFTSNQQALIELANEISNKGRSVISGTDAETLLGLGDEVNTGASQKVKVLDHRFSSSNNPAPGHYRFEGPDGHIHIHNIHISCR